MIKNMRFLSILILVAGFVWACGNNSNTDAPKAISGSDVYRTRCVTCHGTDGKMGMNGAKDLTSSPLDEEQRMIVVTNGRNLMPAFRDLMSAKEIEAVAKFTMTLK